jgi:hypothetical protein
LSYQDDESVFEHVRGLGIGIPLVIGGLVFTIGNIWLGAGIGIPLILIGIIAPLVMSREARHEHDRQEMRSRRDHHNPADGYNISSKNIRRRRP